MFLFFSQVAQAYDDSVTQEVTNHLFQEPGKKWGMDLAAINMQRGREQGIPGYGRYERTFFHKLQKYFA
jgi:peroxidase